MSTSPPEKVEIKHAIKQSLLSARRLQLPLISRQWNTSIVLPSNFLNQKEDASPRCTTAALTLGRDNARSLKCAAQDLLCRRTRGSDRPPEFDLSAFTGYSLFGDAQAPQRHVLRSSEFDAGTLHTLWKVQKPTTGSSRRRIVFQMEKLKKSNPDKLSHKQK